MFEWNSDPTLRAYFKNISLYSRITHKREKELSIIIHTSKNKKDVESAKKELITANLALVVRCAIKYMNAFHSNLSIMDLISVGNLGLIKAASSYDCRHESNSVFSTLAVLSIKRHIEREIKMDSIIHVPMYHFRLRKLINEMEDKYGDCLTDEIIIKETGIPLSLLKRIRGGISSKPFYFEEIRLSENSKWEEIVENSKEDVEQIVFGKSLMAFLSKHVNKLSSKEQDVMCSLYFVPNPLTLNQLGEKYNLTKERIRQIREASLIKLRRSIIKELSDRDVSDSKSLNILKRIRYTDPSQYRKRLKQMRKKEKEIAYELLLNFITYRTI